MFDLFSSYSLSLRSRQRVSLSLQILPSLSDLVFFLDQQRVHVGIVVFFHDPEPWSQLAHTPASHGINLRHVRDHLESSSLGMKNCRIESAGTESAVHRSERERSDHEREAEVRGGDEGLPLKSWVLVVPGALRAPCIPDLYFVWKPNLSLSSTS